MRKPFPIQFFFSLVFIIVLLFSSVPTSEFKPSLEHTSCISKHSKFCMPEIQIFAESVSYVGILFLFFFKALFSLFNRTRTVGYFLSTFFFLFTLQSTFYPSYVTSDFIPFVFGFLLIFEFLLLIKFKQIDYPFSPKIPNDDDKDEEHPKEEEK